MTKVINKIKENTNSIRKKAAKQKPSHEQIAKRAFERFEQKGCCSGDGLDDWYSAEKELNEE